MNQPVPKAHAWGNAVATSAMPVKLNDVMDEELAAKLQREEEEEWEREIEAQFGDRHGVGWCFVEVPSTDCEYGVMSCIQQEVPKEEHALDPNDPDYAFALELQAQEAEEYDRLRRQEASSMERIQVMQQDPPPPPPSKSRRNLRDFLPSNKSSRYHSPDFGPVHLEEEYERESDSYDDHYGYARSYEDADHDGEDLFLEDDLPLTKFSSMEITLRGADRKHPRRTASSTSSSSSSSSASHQHHTARV